MKKRPIKDRFWEKVEIIPFHSCWEWTASFKDKRNRYGSICLNGKPYPAHRLSYEMHNGKIPNGFHVLHSCDNPPCVNPKHLRIGTNADNSRDRVIRGRSLVGIKNHKRVLTEHQIVEIRKKHAINGLGSRRLSNEYKVSRTNIRAIIKGDTWKHLP